MGYDIQAIVSSPRVVLPLAESRSSAHMLNLQKDLAMIPLTQELYDQVTDMDVAQFDDAAFRRFLRLSPRVAAWIVTASSRGAVAYIEAEFFGGTGSQSSVVWKHGQIIHGPEHSRWAINKALRHLGVLSRKLEFMRKLGIYRHYFPDEFELVGLGKCRHTEDWLEVRA